MLSDLLLMTLRYEGWEVRAEADGGAAVRATREFWPDALVLDVMLPDFDGLEVLHRVRAETPDVPVLFLTARDAPTEHDGGARGQDQAPGAVQLLVFGALLVSAVGPAARGPHPRRTWRGRG